ncbi:hypothetical protein CBR_g57336 [Chara braunii]|uniref:Uncharacterized protein n=1 Tax=Chara braunii TaxID=69332 RepID=A0A388ME36_CHABU|nr:hypothetical protein CBR_g57336 [Chara braunii]|eukprot:GBG92817.1 hypothetical protein CBR_g57336 [Chara braunii]
MTNRGNGAQWASDRRARSERVSQNNGPGDCSGDGDGSYLFVRRCGLALVKGSMLKFHSVGDFQLSREAKWVSSALVFCLAGIWRG